MTTETKFKYAIVRLSKKSNHSNIFDLKFKLLDNSFVPKWIDCVLLAQQLQYPISEPWALYNLNNQFNEESIVNRINDLISEINSYEELFDCKTVGKFARAILRGNNVLFIKLEDEI